MLRPSRAVRRAATGPLLASLVCAVISACEQEPAAPPPVDIDDLVARYADDPNGVRAEVLRISDPVLLDAAVMRLVEEYPGRTEGLCDSVPFGPAQDRCTRFNNRPHLWGSYVKSSGQGVESWSRPDDFRARGTGAEFPDTLLARWAETAPRGEACAAGDTPFHLCLEMSAADAAKQGDVEAAAGYCVAAAEGRIQWDCFYSAALAVTPKCDSRYAPPPGGAHGDGTEGAFRYPRAAELCLGAGEYAAECHGHVLQGASELGAAAAASEADRLRQAVSVSESIELFWGDREPRVGRATQEIYWALTLRKTVERGLLPSGNVLEAYPEGAHPHLRAAVAQRLIDAEDPLEATRARLAGSFETADGTDIRPHLEFELSPRFWGTDLEGEADFGATYYLDVGAGRRATDPDPETDLALAVLEAAARSPSPRLDLIGDALDDERLIVRWSATRLARVVDPGRSTLRPPIDDPDPRVQARAPSRPVRER